MRDGRHTPREDEVGSLAALGTLGVFLAISDRKELLVDVLAVLVGAFVFVTGHQLSSTIAHRFGCFSLTLIDRSSAPTVKA